MFVKAIILKQIRTKNMLFAQSILYIVKHLHKKFLGKNVINFRSHITKVIHFFHTHTANRYNKIFIQCFFSFYIIYVHDCFICIEKKKNVQRYLPKKLICFIVDHLECLFFFFSEKKKFLV